MEDITAKDVIVNDRDDLMIEIHELTKIFGNGHRALNKINIRIEQGEIYGLLGPNGAGKSTTLKILATLLEPTSGSVTINGLNIKKDTRRIRNIIGCVFQDTIVDESFTGYENLQLHGALCGIKKDELKQRIAWVSDVLEIKDFLSNKVKFYSGGVKRKLDIAVALINDPQILYMDEPTVGLDPNIRRKLWEHIKHIQKERNMSVIITTHYLDEADYLCGRISIIDRGEIVVTGIPADLKREVEGDSVEVVFQIEDMEIVNQKKESIIKCFEDKMNINGVKFTNNSILVYCNNFGNDIVKISEIISLFDLKPNSFINSSPSLDDVFIKYAGRHLK